MAPLFACLTLSARVQAVSPAPDGGYPDGNTVQRDNGLFGSQAVARQAAVGNQAEKSRQGTCYEGKTTNTQGSKTSTKGCDLSEVREPPIH
jgi:hypothetical protein